MTRQRFVFYLNLALGALNLGYCLFRPNWFNGLIGAACIVVAYLHDPMEG